MVPLLLRSNLVLSLSTSVIFFTKSVKNFESLQSQSLASFLSGKVIRWKKTSNNLSALIIEAAATFPALSSSVRMAIAGLLSSLLRADMSSLTLPAPPIAIAFPPALMIDNASIAPSVIKTTSLEARQSALNKSTLTPLRL